MDAKPPVVWLRLEDGKQVIGPTFADLGTANFVAGLFDNGLSTANSATTDGVSSSVYTSAYPTNLCTIEWWWYPNHASTTASASFPFGATDGSKPFYVQTGFGGGGGVAFDSNSAAGRSFYKWVATWAISTWVHFAFVLDSSLGALTKIDFYVDGVDQGVPTIIGGNDSAWSITNTLTYDVGRTAHARSSVGSQGIMDNYKIFDYKKTDFKDRFNERGGMPDLVT